MYEIILLIHVLIAIALVMLILLQQGRGASMGAAFGSGASNTVFGSQGSGSFLIKITALLGFAFFSTSLILGYIAAHTAKHGTEISVPVTTEQPARPTPKNSTDTSKTKQ